MPRAFATKQIWALALIAGSSVCMVAGSFVLTSQLAKANWLVSHTLEVIGETDASMLYLMDGETAFRGYLVTDQNSFLKPYKERNQLVFEHLNKLQQLTKDNPQQRQRVEKFRQLALARVGFCESSIAARREHGNARARDLVDLAPQKELMDEFRSTMTQIQEHEQQLYADRVSAAQKLQTAMYVIISLMSLLIFAAIAWIVWSTHRFADRHARADALIMQSRDVAVRASELKSQFVANVSHELRTPLSGVLGMSELLLQTETDPEKQEMVEHIFKSAQNLLSLVNDLLDFSKLEAGRIVLQKEPFAVLEVVDQAVQSVSLAAGSKHLELKREIEPALADAVVIGDPDRLRQILLNLIHNAVKFTDVGTVLVSITAERRQQTVCAVRFSIADTGIGLNKETVERLFQPFVQADGSTSRKFGGTGLGLSISKKLVELMSGSIGCDSPGEGEGSTFWFIVPFELAGSRVPSA